MLFGQALFEWSQSVVEKALLPTLVSSANADVEYFHPLSRLLIQMMKGRGPSTDPCGTSLMIGSHSEKCPLSKTLFFPVTQNLIQETGLVVAGPLVIMPW